jgi:hypothetical protein
LQQHRKGAFSLLQITWVTVLCFKYAVDQQAVSKYRVPEW